MTAADVLGRRAPVRATLARQLLLDRAPLPVQLLVRYLAAFGRPPWWRQGATPMSCLRLSGGAARGP